MSSLPPLPPHLQPISHRSSPLADRDGTRINECRRARAPAAAVFVLHTLQGKFRKDPFSCNFSVFLTCVCNALCHSHTNTHTHTNTQRLVPIVFSLSPFGCTQCNDADRNGFCTTFALATTPAQDGWTFPGVYTGPTHSTGTAIFRQAYGGGRILITSTNT